MNLWHALLTVGAYVAAPELVDEIESAEDILGDIAASFQAQRTPAAASQCAAGCG